MHTGWARWSFTLSRGMWYCNGAFGCGVSGTTNWQRLPLCRLILVRWTPTIGRRPARCPVLGRRSRALFREVICREDYVMRYSLVLTVLVAVLTPSTSVALQTAEDTLPERVVDRAIKAFMRHDAEAYIAEWDSVTYFQDLEASQVSAAHPRAPSRMRHAEFARRLREAWGRPDPRGRGRVELIQRLVAGHYVVNHLAMSWEPPHDEQKLPEAGDLRGAQRKDCRGVRWAVRGQRTFRSSWCSLDAANGLPNPRTQPTGRSAQGPARAASSVSAKMTKVCAGAGMIACR